MVRGAPLLAILTDSVHIGKERIDCRGLSEKERPERTQRLEISRFLRPVTLKLGQPLLGLGAPADEDPPAVS